MSTVRPGHAAFLHEMWRTTFYGDGAVRLSGTVYCHFGNNVTIHCCLENPKKGESRKNNWLLGTHACHELESPTQSWRRLERGTEPLRLSTL